MTASEIKAWKNEMAVPGTTAVLRNGWPDFLVVRNGDVFGLEVKTPADVLRPDQETMHEVLRGAGLKVVTKVVDSEASAKSEATHAGSDAIVSVLCRRDLIRQLARAKREVERIERAISENRGYHEAVMNRARENGHDLAFPEVEEGAGGQSAAHGQPSSSIGTKPDRRFMTTNEVMELLGYANRSSFTQFMQRQGVPRVRMSSRKIMFERAAVEAWLQSRTIGGKR